MKTAIILSGGGMKAAYCVGALLGLQERGIMPDIIITGSASSGTGSYFAAGQFTSITTIWTQLLSTKKLIDIKRVQKVFDVDYLIDEVFKKQDSLDQAAVTESPITYLIPATDMASGEVHYFSNRDSDFNVFESMRASMAYPLLYGKAVTVRGRKYTDGLLSTSPYFHIQKARELGADRIFVVDSAARTNRLLYKLWLSFKSNEYRRLQLKHMNEQCSMKDVTVIKLGRKIGNLFDNRKETIQRLIAEGRRPEGFGS